MAITEAELESQYEKHLEALGRRQWSLEDVPFYHAGQAPDFGDYEHLDYFETYQKIWGRKCGENGIGRLREVAITKITEAEDAIYDEKYPFHEDMAWLNSHGILPGDFHKMQEQQHEYGELLEQNGVKVHLIDWGEAPMSAFGPMHLQWAPSDLWVIRGGSIIQKPGWHPFSFGRSEFLARWAQHHLGIPILYTLTGKAVQEPATTMWFAENVWVTGISCAYNAEGNSQLLPIVRRSARTDDLEVHTVHLPTNIFFDRKTGVSAHLTMVLCALDIDKALIYPPGLDTETHSWLRAKGYKVIEVDKEEQIKYAPTNIIPLEPGVVFMVKEAHRTIKKVRQLGVEVIEVPNEEFSRIGGALHCRTLRILREPGPYK